MIAVTLLGLLLSMPPSKASPSRVETIVAAARAQVGVTVRYDPSYRAIAYPGGDVPRDRGACTDVIIRAYRAAGIDLQRLVHDDMVAAFDAYPRRWGLARPDPNIDHRRIPNLVTFFERRGAALSISAEGRDHAAGDIVIWRLPSGAPHMGVVSDRVENGRPFMIHNLEVGVRHEDRLFAYPITGHFRYQGQDTP